LWAAQQAADPRNRPMPAWVFGKPFTPEANQYRSWHLSVKLELRRIEHLDTKAQVRAKAAAWIEGSNTCRRHSACHMMPPVT
jgi:hypothetical protein